MNSHDAKRMAGNEDLIKRLFNKVYSAIIQEEIFCPPETAVILAAYACQAKFGDAYDVNDPIPPVKELLPKSIIDNHTLSIHDWETRISRWHLKLHDVSFLDSIVEYLDIAQDVELYGASIFEVETKSGSRKWISLDAVGLNIYESKRKPPTKRYLWADIKSFEARENRLEIVLTHSPDHLTEFYVKNHYATDLLVNLYRGSKELYGRRKVVVGGSKYLRRSESNSSMRLRPHKLTKEELAEIERLLTELELELPHRATGFEYAPWQVKDHQRQAKALEVKLNLSIPSTEETRKMLRRVADIIVFLGQTTSIAPTDTAATSPFASEAPPVPEWTATRRTSIQVPHASQVFVNGRHPARSRKLQGPVLSAGLAVLQIRRKLKATLKVHSNRKSPASWKKQRNLNSLLRRLRHRKACQNLRQVCPLVESSRIPPYLPHPFPQPPWRPSQLPQLILQMAKKLRCHRLGQPTRRRPSHPLSGRTR
uniref:Radixin n=1 Tax=Schistocephalus solidus TaxID=70667 RepID=A0A0V0J6U1_SCHSO